MKVFADTSGFYALIDRSDCNHDNACTRFADLESRGAEVVTTSYVLQETVALLQKRAGILKARQFIEGVFSSVDVAWVNRSLHDDGLNIWKEEAKQDLSLTDCISFAYMRLAGLDEAFAFDKDFEKHGFRTL